MKYLSLASFVAFGVLVAVSASAQTPVPPPIATEDNCVFLRANPANADDLITWQLPPQTDGTAYTGPGDVYFWAEPDRARIGGTVTFVGHCSETGGGADRVLVHYEVQFTNGVATIPFVGGDVWTRTILRLDTGGIYQREHFLPSGATSVTLVAR